MKITMETTADVVTVKGQPCRIWKGHTDQGSPCLVYVALVQTVAEHGPEFEAGLTGSTPVQDDAVRHATWRRHHGPQPQ